MFGVFLRSLGTASCTEAIRKNAIGRYGGLFSLMLVGTAPMADPFPSAVAYSHTDSVLENCVVTASFRETRDCVRNLSPTVFGAVLAVLVLLPVGGCVYCLRRLKANERRWRGVFDAAPLALVASDAAGRIVYWNATASRLFGWSEQEALGKNRDALLTPEKEQAHTSDATEPFSTEDGTAYALYKHRTRSGQVIRCEWRNAVCRHADGSIAGTISIGTDVGEWTGVPPRLNRAEEIAEQLFAEQRQFFAMLSHEIRGPLASVGSVAQFLQLRCAAMCRDSEAIERILRGIRRLSVFIGNCLSEERLAQIEATGQWRLDEDIVLDDWIRSVWEQAVSTRPIRLNCPAALGRYQGDSQLLRVMLDNLLDNACKYSPVDGAIVLHAMRNADRELILAVEDKGAGIAPDELERVTERCFRGKNATQTGGVGWGLFLVKRIVDLHRGELRIDSQPGQGTCVTVRLPAVAMPQEHA